MLTLTHKDQTGKSSASDGHLASTHLARFSAPALNGCRTCVCVRSERECKRSTHRITARTELRVALDAKPPPGRLLEQIAVSEARRVRWLDAHGILGDRLHEVDGFCAKA